MNIPSLSRLLIGWKHIDRNESSFELEAIRSRVDGIRLSARIGASA